MFINYLHKLLISPNAKPSRSRMIFWLSLSMTCAAIYAILGLQQAFANEYVVQDDARQHVFWMVRFLDPDLFPNDLIADYYQSVAPGGYFSLYWAIAQFGVNPMFFNKILPPVLGLITTFYCFGVSLQLIPLPFTAFLATLMLNQNLWVKDDLASGTPRAFVYPFFLAFLYYLLRRSLLPYLAAIILLGLFYPQGVFICAGILVLRLLNRHGRSKPQHRYLFYGVGLAVAFAVMLPYALKSTEFAPVITLAQAKQLPELYLGGRSVFFNANPIKYLTQGRPGMFPKSLLTPVTLCAAFGLPFLIKFRSKFPLLKHLSGEVMILAEVLLTSVGLFFAAHLLLFKLYLPSRYTEHSFRIVLALSAAIVLTVFVDAILKNVSQAHKNARVRQFFAICLLNFLGIVLLFYYPVFIKNFPKAAYTQGPQPALYEFFKKQPKDILIASVVVEVQDIPTFSQRSILVGREYAVPWSFGYYSKFRGRVIELVQAQYSQNLADVQRLIQKYGVDFWVLEGGAFTPQYIENNNFLKQYFTSHITQDKLVEITRDAYQRLQKGNVPALAKVAPNCTVAKIQGLIVLDAKCIDREQKL